MSHRRVRPILAAAIAVPLLLAGCSPQQWGTAAQVGDTRISVQELQRATQAVHDVPLDDALAPDDLRAHRQNAQAKVLEQRILMELIDRAAERSGVTATQAEVGALMEQIRSNPNVRQVFAANNWNPDEPERVARVTVLDNKLQEKLRESPEAGVSFAELLRREAAAAGVEVNPRYGRFSPGDFQVTPVISDNLSRLAERPDPQAAPQ